jgi:hypothetical protein
MCLTITIFSLSKMGAHLRVAHFIVSLYLNINDLITVKRVKHTSFVRKHKSQLLKFCKLATWFQFYKSFLSITDGGVK